MKKGLRWGLYALLMVCLCGCEKEITTQIVQERKVNSGAQPGHSAGKSNSDAEHMTLSEMIKAPESYSVALSRKGLTVSGKGAVVVPDVEMIPIKSVRGRSFSEMEQDLFAEVTFQGGVPSVEMLLQQGEDEAIEEYLINKYYFKPDEEFSESTVMRRETQVDGELYCFYHWVRPKLNDTPVESMLTARMSHLFNLWMYQTEESKENRDALKTELKWDNAIKKGNKLIAELGYDEMQLAGCQYVRIYSGVQSGVAKNIGVEGVEYAISLNYSRVVDNVPISYWSGQESEVVHGAEGYFWPAESLSVLYSETGDLIKVQYSDPYEIVEDTDEEAFLLPFKDIAKVFEKIILSKYEVTEDELAHSDLNLTEVRLGYMRVKKAGKGNRLEGQLIPVWDFMGTTEYTFQYWEDGQWKEGVEMYSNPLDVPLLTVNAMDGSIIER